MPGFAREIQYDRSWISRALSGQRLPPWPLIEAITRRCDADIEAAQGLWAEANAARGRQLARQSDGYPPANLANYQQFCHALRDLLERRGISQRELVRRDQTGLLRRSTVGAVLRVQRSAPRDVTIAIVRVGGLRVKPSKQVANPGLEVLIRGAGYTSLERFAQVVNHRSWEMHGVKTSYDHITVKRWLYGSQSQNPDVVAAVLSDAWGIPIPVEAIWPELREGKPAVPAYLQPWAADRTLDELGIFVRSDMLTRRETLTEAVKAMSGPALLAPITRWLGVSPGRLEGRDQGVRRIGTTDVEAIERSARYFAAADAEVGGTLSLDSREARQL